MGMALAKHCEAHPDRPAIGVCVITKRPICAVCSTPYNGVNYSREGLAILLERERVEQKAQDRTSWGFVVALLATAPVFAALMLSVWHGGGQFIVDFVQDFR